MNSIEEPSPLASSSTTASPFSKHLIIPQPKINNKTKTKSAKKITFLKALTRISYRQYMEEKRSYADDCYRMCCTLSVAMLKC